MAATLHHDPDFSLEGFTTSPKHYPTECRGALLLLLLPL